MNTFINAFIYAIPLIVIIVILLIKRTGSLNVKSIMQSVGVLFASVAFYFLLYYVSPFVMVNNTVLLMATAILFDVVLQCIIIFAGTILYRKVFGLNGKVHIWSYIILIACIIISSVLYYVDYSEMYTALENGIDDISFFISSMYMPRFVNVRRILSIIPAIAVIVESFRKGER